MVDRRIDTGPGPVVPERRIRLVPTLMRLAVLAGFIVLGLSLAGLVGWAHAETAPEAGLLASACSSENSPKLMRGIPVNLSARSSCVPATAEFVLGLDLRGTADRVTTPIRRAAAVERGSLHAVAGRLGDPVQVAVDRSIAVLRAVAPRPVESDSIAGHAPAEPQVTRPDVPPALDAEHRVSESEKSMDSWSEAAPSLAELDDARPERVQRPTGTGEPPARPFAPAGATNSGTSSSAGGPTMSAMLPVQPADGELQRAWPVVLDGPPFVLVLADEPSVSPD